MFDYKIENMVSLECYQVFRFKVIYKKHETIFLLELPLMVTSTKGKDDVLKAYVYIIEADVTFLCRRKT